MKFFENIKNAFGKSVDYIKSKFTNDTQQNAYECGPSALRMLLDLYDLDFSKEELKKKLKTDRSGTNWENIEDFILDLKKFELRQQNFNTEAAQNYLSQSYPLFVCWDVLDTYSHYSVLLSLDKPKVKLLNPLDTRIISEAVYENFMRKWEHEHYWFAVLIPYENILNRKKISDLLSRA